MRVAANGIEIELDDRGAPDGEPLLLIMGLAMQLIAWPEELVQALVSRGFRVLRFDNRDAGLSTDLAHLGLPNMPMAVARHLLHLPVHAPYSLGDMAADAVALLDALGIERAHVCGASMGGMIAQHLAARWPQRVRSVTLMMTSTGARGLPQPHWRVQRALLSRPASSREEDIVARLVRLWNLIGSPAYRPAPELLRERLVQATRRSWRPEGSARQLLAIAADGDRRRLAQTIRAPALVIHGAEDALVPLAHGRDVAAHVPGAEIDVVPGMGHDLPLPLLPRFVDGMARVAARGSR